MKDIISSISMRGNGSIYLGVVGAVRTGKSTFIKKVIETLVVPNIEDEYDKKKCLDEIPQSSNGKQIMTTEPKFVPSNGAIIRFDDFSTNIKLIDCVGFVIDEAIGYEDNEGNPRLVNTPWDELTKHYQKNFYFFLKSAKYVGYGKKIIQSNVLY